MEYIDKAEYQRKMDYLLGYARDKAMLRRLQEQREEYASLRSKANALGTVVQSGKTSDTTADTAIKIMDIISKLDYRIGDSVNKLTEVIRYIEHSDVSETDKLILICKFVRGLHAEEIAELTGEAYHGRAAFRKRIRRIVEKLPEIK